MVSHCPLAQLEAAIRTAEGGGARLIGGLGDLGVIFGHHPDLHALYRAV
jgi:hypothetical protein